MTVLSEVIGPCNVCVSISSFYCSLKSLLSERDPCHSPTADCAVTTLESSCKPHPLAALIPAAAGDGGRRREDDGVAMCGGVLQDLMVEVYIYIYTCMYYVHEYSGTQ